jgi:hypothetical protein
MFALEFYNNMPLKGIHSNVTRTWQYVKHEKKRIYSNIKDSYGNINYTAIQ